MQLTLLLSESWLWQGLPPSLDCTNANTLKMCRLVPTPNAMSWLFRLLSTLRLLSVTTLSPPPIASIAPRMAEPVA